MPSLHIRDLDDHLLAALKARAARQHRSVQGEVKALLEAAIRNEDTPDEPRRIVVHTVAVGGTGNFSRAEIYGDDDA